jgi:hypothetical protein
VYGSGLWGLSELARLDAGADDWELGLISTVYAR